MRKIRTDELRSFCVKALESVGVCAADAETTADVLVTTDKFGVLTHGTKNLYHGIGYVCDFTFDTYDAKFGIQSAEIGETEIKSYIKKGWLDASFSAEE